MLLHPNVEFIRNYFPLNLIFWTTAWIPNLLFWPLWLFSIPFEIVWNVTWFIIISVLIFVVVFGFLFIILVGAPILIPFVIFTSFWIFFWLGILAIDGIIVTIIYFEAPELFDKANPVIIDKESAKRAAGIKDGGSH